MFHTSKLRGGGLNGFMRGLKLLPASVALVVLLPVAANAYTIILLSGRSIEIPANFSVTRAGITYEHSPGLYVTIQMSTIDIGATERANNEPQGSLLRRAAERRASTTSPASGMSATRTLTDKELEGARRRREASEAVYERRRAELGLPSIEETRRQREEETRRITELAVRDEAAKAESESYWRMRATELRTAIAVNESEINYLRSKLRDISNSSTVAFTTVATSLVTVSVPGRFRIPTFPNLSPPTFPGRVSRRGSRAGGIGFGGGTTQGRIFLNPRGSYSGYAWPRYAGQNSTILQIPIYAPYGYDQSYEQSMIWLRLSELERERAGLQARWRMLEEEARRAGAPPGWLRP